MDDRLSQQQVLASVNGLPVTAGELEEALLEGSLRSGTQPEKIGPEQRRAVLDQLIGKKLLLADAAKNLYEYDPTFQAELKKLKEDLLVNFALSKALEGVSVSDAEAKAFFEENKAALQTGETVNASHILLDDAERAKALRAEILSGSISFEDAARKYSTCPSAEQGGSLGEFTRGQMVPEFDEACFSMAVGEISEPVKTQFGYHLIKLNAKSDSRALSYEELAPQIKEKLLSDKRQAAYRSKINQLKILYPVTVY